MSISLSAAVEQAHSALLNSVLLNAALPAQHSRPAVPDASVLDDRELRHAFVALEHLLNSAAALQALTISEMGRRAQAIDDAEIASAGYSGTHLTEEFVVDEISLLAACTKNAAASRYEQAMRTSRSPSVMCAWIRGRIDGRKAESITRSIARCDGGLPDDVVDAAIGFAEHRTPTQLREWLRRREIAVDPHAAEKRRLEALAERLVTITPGEDGMSVLWARLPSLKARQIQLVIDQVARECGSDDPRTMDQRRADSLSELITGTIEPPDVLVQVLVPHDTLIDTSNSPAWATGVGPITADEAREVSGRGARSVFRRMVTDPATGVLTDRSEKQYRPSAVLDDAVRQRDVTCRFPGCRRSALGAKNGTDLDHTVPWPRGATSADNLAVLCRRHHRLKHSPGWQVSLASNGTMTWTTPAGRTYVSEPWQYTDPDSDGKGRPPDPDPPDPPALE